MESLGQHVTAATHEMEEALVTLALTALPFETATGAHHCRHLARTGHRIIPLKYKD